MEHSHIQLPPVFHTRMKKQLAGEYEAFVDSLSTSPSTTLRWNPLKVNDSPFPTGIPIPWHPQGVRLNERPLFVADPLFHAGAYYVQEASSMLLYQMMDLKSPVRILDLCGAPGGKSTLLAGAMHPDSLLVSNEVIRSRASVLTENLTKWGHPHTIVTQSDPVVFSVLKAFFDFIVVDAPCSGEGLFRKYPKYIESWSQDQVYLCAARQKRILADVLPALKPGGRLIYSTCTYAPEENEENIQWLLNEFGKELEIDLVDGLEKYGAELVKSNDLSVGWRCYPHKFNGEGFFITRIKKRGLAEQLEAGTKTKMRRNRKKVDRNIQTYLHKYTKIEQVEKVLAKNDEIWYLPGEIFPEEISRHLKIILSGVKLGTLRKNEITPDHHLAMSILINPEVAKLEVSQDLALKYLRKEEWNDNNVAKGWYLCQYKGLSLGWIKSTGSKLKNHYPINWRIRKQF